MKQQDSRKRQMTNAFEEVNELPNLSIAEKATSTHFETRLENYRIFEPDVMVSLIPPLLAITTHRTTTQEPSQAIIWRICLSNYVQLSN